MKKRCERGKSCGATCISKLKVCLYNFPEMLQKELPKFSNKVKDITNTPPQPQGDGKLEDLSDKTFKEKIEGTKGFYNDSVREMHMEIQKILGFSNGLYNPIYSSPEEEARYSEARRKLESSLGKTSLQDMEKAIRSFTESYYGEIRDIQRGKEIKQGLIYVPPSMIPQLKTWGEDIERLLGSPTVPKPEVEKFRGLSVTPEHLSKIIENSRAKVTLPDSATSSWSTSLEVARNYSTVKREPENTERVIFRTMNKTGVPIESLSGVSDEFEVLTSKNSRYKFYSYNPISYNGETYHVFNLEEIPGS